MLHHQYGKAKDATEHLKNVGLIPYNDIFPLVTCQYHGRDVPCPNDPVAFSENWGYGDISISPGHPEETRIGRNASRCLFENGYASLAAYQKGEKYLDQFKIRTTESINYFQQRKPYPLYYQRQDDNCCINFTGTKGAYSIEDKINVGAYHCSKCIGAI